MSMTLATLLMVGLTGGGSMDVFDIKDDNRTLYVQKVSPDGKTLLLSGDANYQSVTNAYLFNSDKLYPIRLDGPNRVNWIAVRDDGSIVGTQTWRGYEQGFIADSQGIHHLVADDAPVAATSCGPDGKIFGRQIATTQSVEEHKAPTYSRKVRWVKKAGDSWQVLMQASSQIRPELGYIHDSIEFVTDRGPLGQFWAKDMNSPLDFSNREGFLRSESLEMLPVYQSVDVQENKIGSTQRAQNFLMLSAASLTGDVIAGNSKRNLAIWKGKERQQLPKDSLPAIDIYVRSFDADGNIGVGSHYFDNPDCAIVWTSSTGVMRLTDYLKSKKIDVAPGWEPVDLRYVSSDGNMMIGSARKANGTVRPFSLNLENEPEIEFERQD